MLRNKREKNYLAFDLGAESGRAILGKYDGSKISLHEVHRFTNAPVSISGTMYWDVLNLFSEMKRGLALAGAEGKGQLSGIGCDSWGVDFGLIGKGDILLGNPCHYRDSRTIGMLDEAFKKVSREEIFQHTGLQFLRLNTLYQLFSMAVSKSPLLQMAQCFLMMADLFNFFFTGVKVSEFTLATTSQIYNPVEGNWSRELLEKLGIPSGIVPEITAPGTVVGNLLPKIVEETNLSSAPSVIAPACHDTASAVAAVPAEGDDWAYLSCGTWSLLGIEIPKPIINDKVLEYNFTNEGGVNGTFRLLKNITGLWLLQQCKKNWEKEGNLFSYSRLTEMAAQAQPFLCVIEPDYKGFENPPDMSAEIIRFCKETSQKVPVDRKSIVRCILESLAFKYRFVVEQLEEVSGCRIERLHLIGGGVRNSLLCRFTANALGIPVIAGPVEAAAVGNLLMQAKCSGDLSSLTELREIVRKSFSIKTYLPEDTSAWEESYHRFKTIAEKVKCMESL